MSFAWEANPKERVELGLNGELTGMSAVRMTLNLSLNQAGVELLLAPPATCPLYRPSLVIPDPER